MATVKVNLISNYIGAAIVAVLSLVFAPIYVRLLGVETYGLIGFFTSTVMLAQILDLGLSSTLNRELARRTAVSADPAETRDLSITIERIYLIIGLGMGILFIVLSPVIARHWFQADELSTRTVTSSLMIMGTAFGLRWCSSLYTAGLSGLQRQVPINIVNVGAAAAQYGGAVVILSVFRVSVIGFFVFQAIVGLFQTVVLRTIFFSTLPPSGRRGRWSPQRVWEMRGFALGLTAISATAVLLTQADRLILSGVMPLREFGFYAFAANAAMALGRIVGPMFNAFFPRISAYVAADDREGLAHFYRRSTQLMALMVIPLTATLAFYAEVLLLFWTKQPELVSAVVWPFRLLIVGHAFNALMNIPYALQLAHGWTSLAFRVNIVWLIVFIPGLWFGYQAFGVIAASALWPILNFGYVVFTIPIMHSRIEPGLMVPWYGYAVVLPIAISALVVGSAYHLLPATVFAPLVVGPVSFLVTAMLLPDLGNPFALFRAGLGRSL